MFARRSLTLMVALCSSVTLMCATGIDERQLECEEAVARLQECCPDLRISELRCHPEGCDGVTTPTLTLDESKCILNETCGAITSADTCHRVEAVGEVNIKNAQYDPSSSPVTTSKAVCP